MNCNIRQFEVKEKKMSKEPQCISSPFSTGGGGHDFEFLVGTYYLISMLKKSIPLGLQDGFINYLLFDILSITYEIYIFSEWDQLIPLFQEQNMINFLYFMHMINEIFKNIADDNEDFDSMIEDICDLGRIIESVNSEQLIYNNYLSDEIKEKLKQCYK